MGDSHPFQHLLLTRLKPTACCHVKTFRSHACLVVPMDGVWAQFAVAAVQSVPHLAKAGCHVAALCAVPCLMPIWVPAVACEAMVALWRGH